MHTTTHPEHFTIGIFHVQKYICRPTLSVSADASRGICYSSQTECHSLVQVAAEQEAARDAGEEDEGPLEVEGFLFKRLLERKPEKRQELLTLRDHLLASSSTSDTLKVPHTPLVADPLRTPRPLHDSC